MPDQRDRGVPSRGRRDLIGAAGGTLLRREEPQRFSLLRFFLQRFPRAVHAHAPFLAIAAALFATTALLGLGVAVFEPGVATALLGAANVENLQRGELWTESLTTTVPPATTGDAWPTPTSSSADCIATRPRCSAPDLGS